MPTREEISLFPINSPPVDTISSFFLYECKINTTEEVFTHSEPTYHHQQYERSVPERWRTRRYSHKEHKP